MTCFLPLAFTYGRQIIRMAKKKSQTLRSETFRKEYYLVSLLTLSIADVGSRN